MKKKNWITSGNYFSALFFRVVHFVFCPELIILTSDWLTHFFISWKFFLHRPPLTQMIWNYLCREKLEKKRARCRIERKKWTKNWYESGVKKFECLWLWLLLKSRYFSRFEPTRTSSRRREHHFIVLTFKRKRKKAKRRKIRHTNLSVELRSIGSNDVPDRCPADGTQSLATSGPSSMIEGQSAIVAQAHVAARIEDTVDTAFVADGAFATGASASRVATETLRQRFHVGGSRAGRQNTRRKRLLHHMSWWDGLINRLRLMLLWPRWTHAGRCMVDGRLFGHWRRWWNGAQQTDSSGTAIDIKNSPQR